jgi:hypothetical protein
MPSDDLRRTPFFLLSVEETEIFSIDFSTFVGRGIWTDDIKAAVLHKIKIRIPATPSTPPRKPRFATQHRALIRRTVIRRQP